MSATLTQSNEVEVNYGFSHKSFADLPVYDQRYLPRWHTSNKAFYRYENDNVLIKSRLIDLTFTGSCLYTDEKVQVYDRLEMEIFLTPKDSFQVKGTVLWKESSDQHSFAGVQFDPMPEHIQELILEFGFLPAQLGNRVIKNQNTMNVENVENVEEVGIY